MYEVTYSDDNENVMTEVVEVRQIGFGATCPVEISSPRSDDESKSLEGEIVLCTPSPHLPFKQICVQRNDISRRIENMI